MKETCFRIEDKPAYLIGANYWSRKTGTLMWRKWNPDELKNELEQMKGMGMNVCRSFLYFPDFMPVPNSVNKEMIKRLKRFIDICKEVGIYTIPSLFVGHMSGEDWDVEWREGRNFYKDPWMLKQESIYVFEVVKNVGNKKAILGWLLSNEITNYAGTADAEVINNWINTICSSIRRAGNKKPVSTGDGIWGRELYGKDNGFRINEHKEFIDFFGPHIYLYESDTLRHSYIASFTIKLCNYGLPVLLQEFGCSNCYASEEHQADYYRTTYHSTLLAGAVGTLCWCYTDFDLQYQRPYSHHAHELFFGVTRKDGSEKPAGNEIKRFSNIIDKLNLSNLDILENKSGILIPSYFSLEYPYSFDNKEAIRKVLLQAYTLTKQAHINSNFIREPQLDKDIEMKRGHTVSDDLNLLIAPNLQKLTVPYWNAILEFVEKGGVFYCSYHYDMWIHIFEELFGAKHGLRFGIADIPESDTLKIKFIREFSYIKEGDEFTYNIGSKSRDMSFCPLIPTVAEVIALDNKDEPAILLNTIGKGKVIFSAYPLEYYLSKSREVYKRDKTYKFYKSIAEIAGISNPFDTDNPFVELGILKGKKNIIYILWIINHSWESVDGKVNFDIDIKSIRNLETNEDVDAENYIPYSLDPKEVVVYILEI